MVRFSESPILVWVFRYGFRHNQDFNMHKPKILLSIDGSVQSKYAATVCFNLAKKTGAQITAQHVIDSKGVRQFISYEKPGLLGEKCYEASCQAIVKELKLLAGELETVFRKQAAQSKVTAGFVVDEGDAIEEISRRSMSQDLVMIGHRHQPIMPHELYRRQFMRLSIAESLAQDLHRPLLIVQDQIDLWDSMTILTSPDYLDADYFDACLDLAHKFQLNSKIVCLASSDNLDNAKQKVAQFTAEVVLRAEVPFEVLNIEEIATNIGGYLHKNHILRSDIEFFKGSLTVMPTMQVSGKRHTLLQDSPAMLVRFLSLPSMLLLPEETFTWKRNKAENGAVMLKR
jgi:nucleotide-binding universal stress UspA family protein